VEDIGVQLLFLAGRRWDEREDRTHVRRAEDGSIPVGHHHVVAIGETIRASI
jgi:hypothetical protein